jgi:octaprenyl-diphosphate synthase
MALAPIPENSFPALDQLSALVANPMGQVDELIDENLKSDSPLIEQITKHLIQSGGKRLRPSLVILASHIHGGVSPSTLALAAAVEFIHTATLLHDDVIDDSDLRRGVSSAHKVWGNTAAILVGDFLFAKAFELMVTIGDLRILQILSKTSAVITAGEVRQLVETHSFDLSIDASLKIIGAKTAELFGAACQAGALVAGSSDEDALNLYRYGYNLGLVFQITDDVLDYQLHSPSRGKVPGDDFREGKITLPVLYASANASPDEREFLHKTMIELQQTPDDFLQARELIQRRNGFKQSLTLATEFINQAQGVVKNHRYGDLLNGVLIDCLNRTV